MDRYVLLAGGVGGARMAEGLARALPEGSLTVIANVGDDDRFYGLHISPDIDTIIYTLSDRIDRRQGWGVKEDTVRALEVLGDLDAPVWMKLGDSDFGLHIWRSWRLANGASLTEVTDEAARRLGASARVIPATNDTLKTKLRTDRGWMDFQPWFVQARCGPTVLELKYEGAGQATASLEAIEAIAGARAVFIAPSNPLLSIEPILAVPGIAAAIRSAGVPVLGVSPLIGGKAVKGPLGRLLDDLQLPGGAAGAALRYDGLIDGFVVDAGDHADIRALTDRGLAVCPTDIMMPDGKAAERLAREMLAFLPELTLNSGKRRA